MTYFIRTKENLSLFDCEITFDNENNEDIKNEVSIKIYSELLLKLSGLRKEQFIEDCDELKNLRETWWETEPSIEIEEFVSDSFEKFAEEWDLSFITD